MLNFAKLGLIGCLLLVAAGPMSASSREYDGMKIAHRSFRFDQTSMLHGDSLAQYLQAAGFSNSSHPEKGPTNLEQFAATLTAQATAEQWKSLTVDVWVGRKNVSAGYFFRYHAADAKGAPTQGEAFISTDDSVVKANLSTYRSLLGLNG